MKILKIYDPAMCCSSGVCGPDVDTGLVQLASFLKSLGENAIQVERYNLSQEPAAYTAGPVADALKENGTDALPLVILDGELISSGEYPDLDKLAARLGVSPPQAATGCCSGSGCC